MKDNPIIAVENSFERSTERKPHPIVDFLSKDIEQYNKEDGWLLHLLGSVEANRKYRQTKLELNVKMIATILYSIMCTTYDANDVDIIACSLGANAKKEGQRRRYLNDIAQDTIQEYFEILHTGDDATATTASLSQSSATNPDGTTASTASSSQSTSESTVADTAITSPSLPHHRQAPTVITTNIEKGSRNFNENDNISPLTIPPSSSETTTSFSFASPLKNTPHNCDNVSIGSPLGSPLGSPTPKQHNTPHDDMSYGSPTPKQATKKTRVGRTPNLNAPSDIGDRRVLFCNDPSTTARTTSVVTATSSIPAPTSVSERAAVVISTSLAWATTRRRPFERIRGGGRSNALSSTTSVTIDKAKFGDDMTISNFIDKLGRATNSKQLVD
jgi:hypothetical protein